MAAQRRSDFGGPAPLSFEEIDAWARLMRQRIEPWEVVAIVKLDLEFRMAHARARAGRQSREEVRESVRERPRARSRRSPEAKGV